MFFMGFSTKPITMAAKYKIQKKGLPCVVSSNPHFPIPQMKPHGVPAPSHDLPSHHGDRYGIESTNDDLVQMKKTMVSDFVNMVMMNRKMAKGLSIEEDRAERVDIFM